MNLLANILLQGAGQNPAIMNIIFIGSILLVFYFFIIRPNAKKAKEGKEFLESLEIGTRVITNGGIHGKITNISENSFTLKIDKNTHIKVDRDCVNPDRSKVQTNEVTEGK